MAAGLHMDLHSLFDFWNIGDSGVASGTAFDLTMDPVIEVEGLWIVWSDTTLTGVTIDIGGRPEATGILIDGDFDFCRYLGPNRKKIRIRGTVPVAGQTVQIAYSLLRRLPAGCRPSSFEVGS